MSQSKLDRIKQIKNTVDLLFFIFLIDFRIGGCKSKKKLFANQVSKELSKKCVSDYLA
jgi:hypothetical protein